MTNEKMSAIQKDIMNGLRTVMREKHAILSSQGITDLEITAMMIGVALTFAAGTSAAGLAMTDPVSFSKKTVKGMFATALEVAVASGDKYFEEAGHVH
jgi:hypothetical protein